MEKNLKNNTHTQKLNHFAVRLKITQHCELTTLSCKKKCIFRKALILNLSSNLLRIFPNSENVPPKHILFWNFIWSFSLRNNTQYSGSWCFPYNLNLPPKAAELLYCHYFLFFHQLHKACILTRVRTCAPALEGGVLTAGPLGKSFTGKSLKKGEIGLLIWEEKKTLGNFCLCSKVPGFSSKSVSRQGWFFHSYCKYRWVVMCYFNFIHLAFSTSSIFTHYKSKTLCISATIYFVDSDLGLPSFFPSHFSCTN